MGSLPCRAPVPAMENILFWFLRTLPCLEVLKVKEFTLKAIRGGSLAWCLVLLPVFSSVCWPLPRTLSAQHANTKFNRSNRIKYKINCQTRSSFGLWESAASKFAHRQPSRCLSKFWRVDFLFFSPHFFKHCDVNAHLYYGGIFL